MRTSTPNKRSQKHPSKCRRREGANHIVRYSVLVLDAWEDDGYRLEPHLEGFEDAELTRRDHARYRQPNLDESGENVSGHKGT